MESIPLTMLKYHAPIFQLMDWEPFPSATNLALIEEWERHNQRRMPEALREWYSLHNSVEMIAERFQQTDLRPDWLKYILGDEIRDRIRDFTAEYGDPDSFLYLFYAPDDIDFLVQFDGTDDPPLILSTPEFQTGPKFSLAMFNRFWQSRLGRSASGNELLSVICYDRHFGPWSLDYLRERFSAGPTHERPGYIGPRDPDETLEFRFQFFFFDQEVQVEIEAEENPALGETFALLTVNGKSIAALEDRILPLSEFSTIGAYITPLFPEAPEIAELVERIRSRRSNP